MAFSAACLSVPSPKARKSQPQQKVELVEVPPNRPKLSTISIPSFDTSNIFKIYMCIDEQPATTTCDALISNTESTDYYSLVDENLAINEIQLIKDVIKLPIEPDDMKRLEFDEQLVVSFNDPAGLSSRQMKIAARPPRDVLWDEPNFQALGGTSISVNSWPDYCNVCVASRFSFEKQGAVNTIFSSIDYELNLIEEHRSEALTTREEMIEKCLNVEMHDGRYEVTKIDRNGGDRNERRHGTVTDRVNGCLVQDACAFLLMRYLVLQKFVGELEAYFMHLSGELCRSCFRVYEPKKVLVHGKPSMVTKVKRTILRKERDPEKSISVYMATGHLIRHCWPGYPYLIHINPLQVDAIAELIEQTTSTHIGDDAANSWQTDIDLYSKYLSLKEDRVLDLRAYACSQPQVMALIRDYVHCLLRSKPDDVLDFSIKHFTSTAHDNVHFADANV